MVSNDPGAYEMIRAAGDVMKWWPVSKDVGSIKNQAAYLAEPVDLWADLELRCVVPNGGARPMI